MKKIAGISNYDRSAEFSVMENAKILCRYEYLERRMVKMMAGWLPGTEQWEIKQMLGRMLWEDAEHTTRLRERIVELRTSARIFDRTPDPHLSLLMDEAILADDGLLFLSGIIVLKKRLVEAYELHIQQTQPLVDYITVRTLKSIIMEEKEHIEESELLLNRFASEEVRQTANRWEEVLDALIHASAGIQGLSKVVYKLESSKLRSSDRTFEVSAIFALDERFQPREFRYTAEDAPTNLDDPKQYYKHMVNNRFHEMMAAQGLAASIYQNEGMPWEYYRTHARHLFDEIRHSAFGQTLFEEMGEDWTQIPHFVGNYHFYHQLSPLERYVRLGIMLELEGMQSGMKKWEVEFCRENGFELGQLFQDYDWADEVNHVDYARTWIHHMTKGDPKAVETSICAIQQKYEEFKRPWEAKGCVF